MLTWQSKPRSKRARLHQRVWLAVIAIGTGLVVISQPTAIPVLVYNPSPSAPKGYYRVVWDRSVLNGDWVLVKAPEQTRRFADSRGYLPASVPMIKTVAGLEGDRVCALGKTILINGAVVAIRLRRDHRGRPLPWWTGCHTLGPTDLFVLNSRAPASFDGRYFGVIPITSIRARVVKL